VPNSIAWERVGVRVAGNFGNFWEMVGVRVVLNLRKVWERVGVRVLSVNEKTEKGVRYYAGGQY
jgi:hypothetical protein